jgi:hypothetical protein
MSPILRPSALLLVASLSSTVHAQEAPSTPAPPAPEPAVVRHGLSFGFNLHRFQDDFGMSLTAATPTIANDSLRITGGGGIAWYPYALGGNAEQTWLPYYHGRVVVEGGRRIEGTPLRLYGVGGVIALFTPSRLSQDVVHVGGYGGFGFEFYMPRDQKDGPVSYLIELGGIGTGLQADKLPAKPIIANGFLITVGMRLYP